MRLIKLFYYIVTLLFINVINTEDENIDANWMKYISDDKNKHFYYFSLKCFCYSY